MAIFYSRVQGGPEEREPTRNLADQLTLFKQIMPHTLLPASRLKKSYVPTPLRLSIIYFPR